MLSYFEGRAKDAIPDTLEGVERERTLGRHPQFIPSDREQRVCKKDEACES